MNDLATMLAFGASNAACYKWPADTELDKACRAAFCDGAASCASKIESDAKVIAALREALNLFVVHSTYPVSTEINPRGYAWRDERALDYAFGEATKALGSNEQTLKK